MTLLLLIVFSLSFPATHLLMSHGSIRARLVSVLGVWPFRAVYSIVSLLTLGAAVEIFRHNMGLGPELWALPWWLALLLAVVLMFFGLQLFFLSLATPSPSSLMPTALEARGVLRITRHPMNMAVACFGLAHMLGNGHLGDVAFFGSFLILGLGGPYHLDRRKLRERGPDFAKFTRATSVLPFAAIAMRRNRLEFSELSFPLMVLAALAFAALFIFHGRLFGIGLL